MRYGTVGVLSRTRSYSQVSGQCALVSLNRQPLHKGVNGPETLQPGETEPSPGNTPGASTVREGRQGEMPSW